MRSASQRRASDTGVRRPTADRKARGAADRTDSHGRLSRVDEIGFAVFIAYLVLAFTTASPEQFGLPKLLGLHIYVVFAAVRWVVALRQGSLRPLPRRLAWILGLTAAWAIVTTLTARHVPTALFGMRGRYNGLATMLAGLAVFVFLATRRTSSRERDVERALRSIGVVLTLASVYALVQATGLDPIPWPTGRPASTLGHPVIFGGALAMALPFSLAFALGGTSRRVRAAWGGAALIQGLALILTLARGPWAGAGFGLLVFAALVPHRGRALASRAAVLACVAVILVSAVLALAKPARAAIFERVSTLGNVSDDSSYRYRVHFGNAALAMLRDYPLFGVGWENFGLLYHRVRTPPTPAIASDLVPTMVHSGPLQTAVSGGVPALVLQFLVLGTVAVLVARRWRAESDDARLLGAALLASMAAYFVQDLSGWPHVVLGALALSIWGLGVSWSVEGEPQPQSFVERRWTLALLAMAVAVGAAWMALDTWLRIRADRLMFQARQLDVESSWSSVERKVQAALDLSPDRAWANATAAELCQARVAAAGDRRAYERGVALADAAYAANPLDPYVRLRRTELDVAAIDRDLIARVSDSGRDALAVAKSMTVGSTRVWTQEKALARAAGDSRILFIQPENEVGFGPAGSLVVTGRSPGALPGTHVFLHWRNVTRKSPWAVAPYAPVPDRAGGWHNAIANARLDEEYEVYSTSETWSYGPCTYPGNGSINLCGSLAFVGPDTTGTGPPGSVMVAGTVPEAAAGSSPVLRWRNATRASAWTRQPFYSEKGVAFPPDAPGNWYAFLPRSNATERFEVSLASETAHTRTCAYGGDGARRLCSPIAWIQPQAMAGFGPPGSLVVAGFAPGARDEAPVYLHWRNATRRSDWITEPYAATPDGSGSWYNAIPNANLAERYEVFVTSPTTASATCRYGGRGSGTLCQ